MMTIQEAKCTMCVLKPGHREKTSFGKSCKEAFLKTFFPWFYRNVYDKHWYCIADQCQAWTKDKYNKNEGFCNVSSEVFYRN